MTVAVNEIAKHPKLISDNSDIVYIKDKRKNEIKSIVIPASYKEYIADGLKEIEYQMWLKRNSGLLEKSHPQYLDDVVGDIGDNL